MNGVKKLKILKTSETGERIQPPQTPFLRALGLVRARVDENTPDQTDRPKEVKRRTRSAGTSLNKCTPV